MRVQPSVWLVLASSLLGFYFSAVSTRDFVAHLDRQVHGLHCSFVPGLDTPDATGTSGCHVTLMSPYSSLLRTSVWGGIPIAVPAMASFALLLFTGIALVLRRRQHDAHATGILLLFACVPLIATWIYGYLSLVKLDALCKICLGMYAASIAAFAGAFFAWRNAKRWAAVAPEPLRQVAEGHAWEAERDRLPGERPSAPQDAAPHNTPSFAVALLVLALFHLLPMAVYAAVAPNFSRFVGTCGSLPRPADPYNVLLPVGKQTGAQEAIEVLDPLCAACKGFEERLASSGLDEKVRRKALLFPMDRECNWMIDSTIHPGACAISEAVLCAGSRADAVIAWAFANQQRIMQASKLDPAAASRLVGQQFPELGSCLGSAMVRARLNRGLRWSIANQIPVVTPQLYVGNLKVCDEDTDLGLDYVLGKLLGSKESR